MKKRLFILSLLFVLAVIQLYAGDARADILMKNGQKYENVEIAPPGGSSKELKTVIDGKKAKIPSDSIDMVVLWHKDRPKEQYILKWMRAYNFHYKKGTKEPTYNSWFVLQATGENMSYWLEAESFKLKKDALQIELAQQPHFLWKAGDEGPCKVSTLRGGGRTREWLTSFLADDEALAFYFSEEGEGKERWRRGFGFYDISADISIYEDIVNRYTPGRKIEK